MKDLPHRLDALVMAMSLAIALYVLLMLVSGGFPNPVYGLQMAPWRVHIPLILLLVLVILHLPLRHLTLSPRVFWLHEGRILFAACLIIYLANGTTFESGDTFPARYLPLSILRDGTFYLDAFPFLYTSGMPYYLRLVDGHYVSAYPVGAALLALPIYLPSVLGGVSPESRFLLDLEKLSAAVIVALSVVVLYFTLRRLTSRGMALLITVAYALGSSSLSTSSQALWQHGPSQLALTATLWCLVNGRTHSPWAAFAGFPLAFAVISRPTVLLIAIPLGVYVLIYHRAHIWAFILGSFLPVLFQLWYNMTYFGNSFRHAQGSFLESEPWSAPFGEALTGILLSPSRGLFIYSPIFLFSILGIGLAWRRHGDPLLRCLSIGVLSTIMLYGKWRMWWGGYCYGPRLLADLSPALALLLYPLSDWFQKSRALYRVALIVLIWSVSAHVIGAFGSDKLWNWYMDVDRVPQNLWSWTNNQLVNPPMRLFNRAYLAVSSLPTSRTAPDHLSASYHMNLPPTLTTPASKSMLLTLEATNDGQAVWLAWPRGKKGSVTLAWRWLKGDQEVPGISEERYIVQDVFPQQSHLFWLDINPPQEPGSYVLEVGLIAKSAKAGADVRISPRHIPVTVVATTPRHD